MTKTEYEQAIKEIKPLCLKKSVETEGFNHKYCDSEYCELPNNLDSGKT